MASIKVKLFLALAVLMSLAAAAQLSSSIALVPSYQPWTPKQLASLVANNGAWYRADLGIFQLTNGTVVATESNAAPVARWNTQAGTSIPFMIQGTNSLRPLWMNYGSNSFPFLRFRTNYFEVGSSAFLAPGAFWAVFSWPGFGPVGGDIIIASANQGTMVGFSSQFSATELGRAFFYDGLLAYTTNSVRTNQIVLLVVNTTSTSPTGLNIYMNGNRETNGAANGYTFSNPNIGGTRSSAAYFTGDLYEWGFVNGAILTTQERTNLQNYVRGRYGASTMVLGP